MAFLSVGLFHNQHLVNQADQVALNLAHIGNLSVRRLHRLLSPQNTGTKSAVGGATGAGCRAGCGAESGRWAWRRGSSCWQTLFRS